MDFHGFSWIFIDFGWIFMDFHGFSYLTYVTYVTYVTYLTYVTYVTYVTYLCHLYPPYYMSATEACISTPNISEGILRFCSLTNISEHTHVVSSLLCHLCDTGPDPTADPNLSRADPGPDPDLFFLLTPLWCQRGNPRSQLFFAICCRSRRSFIFFSFL